MSNTLSPEQVRDRLQVEIHRAGSAVALAAEWQVSHSALSAVMRGRIDPGPTLLERMQLRRVFRYEPTNTGGVT
jgi:hypothetical protein